MRAPRFQIGTPVEHRSRRLRGNVTAVINNADPADIAAQGFRYCVRTYRGVTWSVPEDQLVLITKIQPRENNNLQGWVPPNLP